MHIPPLRWNESSSTVSLLDQTRLPTQERWLTIETPEDMAESIRNLRVRGAPAIGIAAAYGVVLSVARYSGTEQPSVVAREAIDLLRTTRPTAVNLFRSLNQMDQVVDDNEELDRDALQRALLAQAHAIFEEDRASGVRLGEHGLSLLSDGMCVLTHCHTGGVATSGYGTALAPLLLSKEKGVEISAYVDETRPLLQGSRITAWELEKAGVPATLITDSTAGHVMREEKVQAVFVGADRIAANGDVANKIGTYSLAVLANAHDIPFYVSAPTTTIDLETPTGEEIEIEERSRAEIAEGFGTQTAPDTVDIYNPAFDVTPANLVTAIITERGVVRPPYDRELRRVVEGE